MLEKYLTWFKAHERLLMVLIAALLLFHFGDNLLGTVQNFLAQRDNAALSSANSTLAAQVAANSVLANQNAALLRQLADSEKQTAAVVSQVKQVPSIISAIPPAQLQSDLELKLGGPSLSTPVLQKVDEDITELPLLKQEIIDQSNTIELQQSTIDNLNKQIVGLNAELKDENNVCDAKIKVVKDQAKKKQRLYLKIGLVLGGIFGGFVGHGI